MWYWVLRFSLSRKEEELGRLNEQIRRQEAEKSEKENVVKSLRDEVAKLASVVGNQTELKRKIDDNLQYRKYCRDEEEMIQKIEELEKQLADKGDLQTLEADLKRAMNDLQKLLSEVSFLRRYNCSFLGTEVLLLLYYLRFTFPF